MTCPLCSTSKSIILREYEVDKLRENWLRTFRFDPFPSSLKGTSIQKKRCSKCALIYFTPPYYGDEKLYAELSKHVWYYEKNKWEYDVAARLVATLPVKNMLEIGCGKGFFLDKVKALDVDSFGVDINIDAIQYAEKKGHNVSLIDLFKLDSSYDLIVSFEVLEHMERVNELFSFFADSLLSKNGYLIIAVPNPDSYLKDMEMNLLDMPPHHNSSWSYETFEYVAKYYGFEICDYFKEPLRYVHYMGGVLGNIVNDYEKLTTDTWKSRLIFKVQRLILSIIAPISYVRDRDNIDGQTHLIVLKNAK